MPKLKSILSRVILGESRQKEDGLDNLCAGFRRFMIDSHYLGRDGDDDSNSITSFSTTATADNLPGPGRTVDTYIFQPAGRWIERLAMRFTIASLHPARIAQYIETDETSYVPAFSDSYTLNDAIAYVCDNSRNGSTVVAGMKGLVKQTQMTSIYRSASALAALIRVSLSFRRREIYVNVSRIEPIFHLETLAGSLACSHPEKKWFLFLVKLARETLIAVRAPSYHLVFDPDIGGKVLMVWPSFETALDLRQRLIRALRVYRSSGLDSLEDTVGEACAICATAVSSCVNQHAQGDAYMHILETIYFTVIFVLRSIHELVDFARITENRQIYMVLRTLASWIDAIVYRCKEASESFQRYNIDKLKARILFLSLALVCGSTTFVLLPQSLRTASQVLYLQILPRRHREAAKSPVDSSVVRELIETSKDRTRRLLSSFNKLEREVCENSLGVSVPTSHSKIDADPGWLVIDDFGDWWWKSWRKALEKARRVQVPENLVTEEFREARRIGLNRDMETDIRSWGYYQLRRGTRHKWGQYLRSNMDWDWDLGTGMKRLFKERHRKQSTAVHGSPASSPAIGVAASPEGALQLSFGRAHVGMPKEIKISYETEDGKMQYMSFVPATPVPVSNQFNSSSSPDVVLTPTVVQQDLGYREGSSGGEQEIEDLAADMDASQPEACEAITVEDCDDGREEKEIAYDGALDEVRAGGDTLSICSLD